MSILYAASPVEIEAKADSLHLPAAARAAALALFHGLTSREELSALALPVGRDGCRGGAAWPVHCLLFGQPGELAPVLDALRGRPDAAELAAGSAPEGAAPGVLFLDGTEDGFAGVLLVCTAADRLSEILDDLEASLHPIVTQDRPNKN